MTAGSESTTIRRIADEYRRRGYDVVVEPRDVVLPEDLRGYRLDLIATKDDELVIIEVKRSNALPDDPELQPLAEVAERSGYRFELVVDRPSPPVPAYETVLRRLADAERLLDVRQLEAAFLIAWSALEGALWSLANRYLDEPEGTGLRLVSQLYSEGVVSDNQYAILRHAIPVRNQLTHGFDVDRPNESLVNNVIQLAQRFAAPSFAPVGDMIAWFTSNYEDPAQHVPYETREGGYQYYLGGPYDALDELSREYPDAHPDDIEEAADTLEDLGGEWVKIGQY